MDSEARSRRRFARRVLFVALGVILIAWAGWFISLVAVELRTERIINSAQIRGWPGWTGGVSNAKLVEIIEQASGVSILIVGPSGIEAPSTSYPFDFSSRIGGPDRMTPVVDAIDDLSMAVWIRWPERAQARVEGNHVVIAIEGRAPSFDASAKAREWWHALEDWWE